MTKQGVKRWRIEDSRGWQHAATESTDGAWVRYEDFTVVMDSHNWLFREKERLEKLSTQLQRDNSALISRLARYESAAELPADPECPLHGTQQCRKLVDFCTCPGRPKLTRDEWVAQTRASEPPAPQPVELRWIPCTSGGLWECVKCEVAYCSPPWTRSRVEAEHKCDK